MSVYRIAFAAGLVSLAWTVVVTGLVAVGAKADAAWATTSPGTGFAKADQLGTPTGLHITSSICNGSNQQVSLAWNVPSGAPPATYEVVATSTANQSQTTTTTTTNSAQNFHLPGNKPATVTVRAAINGWHGQYSGSVTGCP